MHRCEGENYRGRVGLGTATVEVGGAGSMGWG